MERHRDFKSFYSEVRGGEGDRCMYPVRLDTYGCGCQHDCAYCYAKGLLDFRGLWNAERPAVASADYIRRKLDRLQRGTIVRLGGMTDCFMPQAFGFPQLTVCEDVPEHYEYFRANVNADPGDCCNLRKAR